MPEKFIASPAQPEQPEKRELSKEYRNGFRTGHLSYGSPRNYYSPEEESNSDYRLGKHDGVRAARSGYPNDPEFQSDLEHPTTIGELNAIMYEVFGPRTSQARLEYNTASEMAELLEKIADEVDAGHTADEDGFAKLNCTTTQARKYAIALRKYSEEHPENSTGYRKRNTWS